MDLIPSAQRLILRKLHGEDGFSPIFPKCFSKEATYWENWFNPVTPKAFSKETNFSLNGLLGRRDEMYFPISFSLHGCWEDGLKSNIPVVYVIVVTTAIDYNIKTGSNKNTQPLGQPKRKTKGVRISTGVGHGLWATQCFYHHLGRTTSTPSSRRGWCFSYFLAGPTRADLRNSHKRNSRCNTCGWTPWDRAKTANFPIIRRPKGE